MKDASVIRIKNEKKRKQKKLLEIPLKMALTSLRRNRSIRAILAYSDDDDDDDDEDEGEGDDDEDEDEGGDDDDNDDDDDDDDDDDELY